MSPSCFFHVNESLFSLLALSCLGHLLWMHLLPDAFDYFSPLYCCFLLFFFLILQISDVYGAALYIGDVYRMLPADGHMKTDAMLYGWIFRACVDVIQRVRVDVIVRQLWGM